MEQRASMVRRNKHMVNEGTSASNTGNAACSNSGGKGIASEVGKANPNTKIIDYPLHISNEEETLALIDEVLNAFGRLVQSLPKAKAGNQQI